MPNFPNDPYNLSRLLERLSFRGVQIWHNRGRLYAGPLKKLDAADRELLAIAKEGLIALLKSEPYPVSGDPRELVAPCAPSAGSYAGRLQRKPWDYEVAVILPTFGDLDLVKVAASCWRRQTVSPYLIVVGTASRPAGERSIEELRDVDCEIHRIAAHGWRHSSQPVAAALDLAFAVCQTNAALLTHVDVFPQHNHVLEDLLPKLTPSCPVVGYQMSPRFGSDEWLQCVSHTLTLVDMKVMRRHRVTWSLLAALEADDEVEQRYLGWPDTETWFGRGLRAAGIVPEFLGSEPNASVYATDLIVHWRSAPSIRHYYPDQVEHRHPGLAPWLDSTYALGVAAELPEAVAAEILRTYAAGHDDPINRFPPGLQHPADRSADEPREPDPEQPRANQGAAGDERRQ